MKSSKKYYYYYFATGKVAEVCRELTIYELAELEAMFGECTMQIYG